MNPGSQQQRAGKLIEEYICNTEHLKVNRRQQKIGYYDAYNKDSVFEIKAISKKNNRATFITKNHKQLIIAEGYYIFVNYDFVNKDKGLSLITDINILQTITMSANDVHTLLKDHGTLYERNYKGCIKYYQRLSLGYILNGANNE